MRLCCVEKRHTRVKQTPLQLNNVRFLTHLRAVRESRAPRLDHQYVCFVFICSYFSYFCIRRQISAVKPGRTDTLQSLTVGQSVTQKQTTNCVKHTAHMEEAKRTEPSPIRDLPPTGQLTMGFIVLTLNATSEQCKHVQIAETVQSPTTTTVKSNHIKFAYTRAQIYETIIAAETAVAAAVAAAAAKTAEVSSWSFVKWTTPRACYVRIEKQYSTD